MMIHISFTAKNCSFVSALMRIGFSHLLGTSWAQFPLCFWITTIFYIHFPGKIYGEPGPEIQSPPRRLFPVCVIHHRRRWQRWLPLQRRLLGLGHMIVLKKAAMQNHLLLLLWRTQPHCLLFQRYDHFMMGNSFLLVYPWSSRSVFYTPSYFIFFIFIWKPSS